MDANKLFEMAMGAGNGWRVVEGEMDVQGRRARSGSGFTLMMEAMIVLMRQQMPVAEVARHLGVHDTQLWRVLTYHVERKHRPGGTGRGSNACWSMRPVSSGDTAR